MQTEDSFDAEMRKLAAAAAARDPGMELRVENRLFQQGQVGRFTIVRKIGSGGMGVVYEAADPKLNRRVALKVLKRNQESSSTTLDRMTREAQALAKAAARHVVAVFEIGEHQGAIFVVMELVNGPSLSKWQKAERRPLLEVLDRYRQAGLGLIAIHRAGLVHRDFKPGNVLIRKDGDVCVADFGLARSFGDDEPNSGNGSTDPELRGSTSTKKAGTETYMAPEQIAFGRTNDRSDQFSFCAALYEAVTGTLPYPPPQLRALARAPDVFEPPKQGFRSPPGWLMRILARGLAANPEQRWPDLQHLVQALERGSARRRRRRWLTVAMLPLAAAAGVTSAVMAPPKRPCQHLEDEVLAIWSADHAVRMRRAAGASSFGTKAVDAIVPRLDQYRAQWVTARTATCNATAQREDSGDDIQIKRAHLCEERSRVALAGVVDLLSTDNALVLSNAAKIVDTLPNVMSCLEDNPNPLVETIGDEEQQLWIGADNARREAAAGLHVRAMERSDALVSRPSAQETTLGAARAWLANGVAAEGLGRYTQAEAAFREAFSRAYSRDNHRLVLEIATAFIEHFARAGVNDDHGRTWETLAMTALSKVEQPGRLTANLLDARGWLATNAKDLENAKQLHQEALQWLDEQGDTDVSRLGQSRRLLANALDIAGQISEAGDLYETALIESSATYGPRHPDVASIHIDLGIQALAADKLDVAKKHFESAFGIQQAAFGKTSPRIAPALIGLAHVDLQQGLLEQALKRAEVAWQLESEGLPIGHPNRGNALAVLANTRLVLGQLDQALEEHMLLRQVAWETFDEDRRREIKQNIAWLLCQVGRCREARTLFESLLFETKPENPIHLYADGGLAQVELAEGYPESAVYRLRRVIAESEEQIPDHLEQKGELHWTLARALEASGAPSSEVAQAARIAKTVFVEVPYQQSVLPDLERMIRADR